MLWTSKVNFGTGNQEEVQDKDRVDMYWQATEN